MELKDFSKQQLLNELEHRETVEHQFPQKLDEPDWNSVIKSCQEYINALARHECDEEDMEHNIFEAAVEAVYGKDVWSFVNAILK